MQASYNWFWFHSDWLRMAFFSQSQCIHVQCVAMQNQSNCIITFDAQLKTALISAIAMVKSLV